MATLQSVTGLARLYLDDIDADVFDDATLLGHINSAYRLLQQALALNEGASTRKIATAAVLAGETTPNVAVVPTDQYLPLHIWEKATGSANDTYIFMDGPLHTLPNITSGETLRYWTYISNLIEFVSATRNNTIRIHYIRTLPALTLPTSVILIPYAEDYLAWMATAFAARARGSADYANDCIRFAQAHLEALLKGAVLMNQHKNYRAPSYGSRR